MTIYQSGNAIYEGINFVDQLGTYNVIFTSDEMAEISAKAKEYGLDTMATKYDQKGVTDLPTTMIGATLSDQYKVIKMRYGYPESLRSFRNYFEGLIKSKEWVLIKSKSTDDN